MYNLNTILPFGKYKGKTIDEVLEIAPSYINWACSTIPAFDVNVQARDMLKLAMQISASSKHVPTSKSRGYYESDDEFYGQHYNNTWYDEF